MSSHSSYTGALSLKPAALIAGAGLLIMMFCAPLAHFYFMPQSLVANDAAATVARLRTNGTPYIIGSLLLFLTYLMDILVAWALYWYFRPGERPLSQLVAWARLVYTALAFIGLWASISAYDLAVSTKMTEQLTDSALAEAVSVQLSLATTMEEMALFLFGLHLCLLSVLIWRCRYVASWVSIPVGLAGLSYIVSYLATYFAPESDVGSLLLLGIRELVFMVWLLAVGWRKQANP